MNIILILFLPILVNINDDNYVYKDVMSRTYNPYIKSDRYTNVHETVHFIQNEVYKTNFKTGHRIQPLYFGNGEVIIIDNTLVTKDEIEQEIPLLLRANRYFYVKNQLNSYTGYAFYLLNEMTAYRFETACYIEDIKLGKQFETTLNGKRVLYDSTDINTGLLELSIYSLGMCKAIFEKHDKEIDNATKEVIKRSLIDSNKIFKESCNYKQMKIGKQKELINNLRHDKSCENLRQFIEKEFNGVFLHD